MDSSHDQYRRTLALLDATPGWHRVCALRDDIDAEMAAAIMESAGVFSGEVLTPLNLVADRVGCVVQEGCVKVPEAYHAAWRGFAAGGWIGVDLPEAAGGSGFPAILQVTAAQLFDRGGGAFNMATGASRSGAVLLAELAPENVAADWVPALIADSGRRRSAFLSRVQGPMWGGSGRRPCRKMASGGSPGTISGFPLAIMTLRR